MPSLNPNRWDGFRIALIAVAIGGVAVVLTHEFRTDKNAPKEAINAIFPEEIPLATWQFLRSTPLAATDEARSDPGRLYQYRQADGKLEIELRHQLYTDSNASRLLMVYGKIPPATIVPQMKYRKDLGYYYLFDYRNRAYLSACIPAAGETTVTQQQYVNNRSRYGWSIPRTVWWLLGQQDLFDGRCLWTVLSMPVDTYSSPDATDRAFEKLEAAWLEWHRWWRNNHFP